MKAYLLTWSPKRWDTWDELALEANKSAAGQVVKRRWSCHANANSIQVGARIFLIRLGKEPKGIMAAGWVTSRPKRRDHWDPKKAAAGKKSHYLNCEWERLLNPFIDGTLGLPRLKRGNLASMHWTPQSSGVQIPASIVDELEKAWADHIGKSSLGNVSVDEEITGFEGEEKMALIRHRKREQHLREAKVHRVQKETGRLVCEVPNCGFDFHNVYGELGRSYCQVHHLKPLSNRTSPRETRLEELAIVCANCHAMIHRGGKCRPLKDLIPVK